jgi:hypothetical protein
MFRPMASLVSALSGLVANGHQVMHSVSSSLSKIPYGGFSPVRLQIGLGPQPSLPGACRAAYMRSVVAALCPCNPCGQSVPLDGVRGVCLDGPIQRPLARLRVVLSRRVNAYYGLIRGPRALPPVYELSGGSLSRHVGTGFEGFPDLLCVSFSPCRLPYPVESSGPWLWRSARAAFAISVSARHSSCPRKSIHAWPCNEAAEFTLCCGPDSRSPFIDKGFYFRAFIP